VSGVKCRRGSVLWRDICDFFFVFSAETAMLCCLVRSFPHRREKFIFESRLVVCFSGTSSLYYFFALKQAANESYGREERGKKTALSN
jgi:hypothetical protein